MMGSGKTVKCMAEEFTSFRMDVNIKEVGRMESFRGKESFLAMIKLFTQDNL